MRQFLSGAGYKKWNTEHDNLGIAIRYQKRVDELQEFEHYPLCSCNDKLFLNIDYHSYSIKGNPNKYEGYEISLVHENKDGDWCDLKIYSLNEDKIKNNLAKYEKQLLDMWSVFNGEGK